MSGPVLNFIVAYIQLSLRRDARKLSRDLLSALVLTIVFAFAGFVAFDYKFNV